MNVYVRYIALAVSEIHWLLRCTISMNYVANALYKLDLALMSDELKNKIIKIIPNSRFVILLFTYIEYSAIMDLLLIIIVNKIIFLNIA